MSEASGKRRKVEDADAVKGPAAAANPEEPAAADKDKGKDKQMSLQLPRWRSHPVGPAAAGGLLSLPLRQLRRRPVPD